MCRKRNLHMYLSGFACSEADAGQSARPGATPAKML
jgi:hypothetical protein